MDATGPMGYGPGTGKGMGRCGGGRGICFGRRYFSAKNDLTTLEEEEKLLEKELETIKDRKKALQEEK